MKTKTFPYAVIWNSEIIPPNTPIEIKEEKDTEKAVETEKPKKSGVK